MSHGPSTAFQIFVACVYPAWSLLWAVLWLKVANHYGRAAWETWNINGATYRSIFCDIFDPLVNAGRDFFCQWKWACKVLRIEVVEYQNNLIPTSSPGNILRFAIFIGSVTPISFGLGFAFVDMWRALPLRLVIILIFMVTSIMSALGHLFLVHRGNPKKWANVVSYSIIWLVVGPFFGLMFRILQGEL